MSLFTSSLLIVACAALLQVGCEARYSHRRSWQHPANRRSSKDRSIALGSIRGSNVITLPEIDLRGPDVILGFPDNCARKGMELLGTQLIVSNSGGSVPVDLVADNADDPLSNVAIHCNSESEEGERCLRGIHVTSYQHCGDLLPSPTTEAQTVSPDVPPSPDSSSISSSSSSSSTSSASASSSSSSSSSASSSASTSTSEENEGTKEDIQ